MDSFSTKCLKKKLDHLFGNSEQGEEIKNIVLKAHTTGFTEDEIEAYARQKEDDLQKILERFSLPSEDVKPSMVVSRELSTGIVNGEQRDSTSDK